MLVLALLAAYCSGGCYHPGRHISCSALSSRPVHVLLVICAQNWWIRNLKNGFPRVLANKERKRTSNLFQHELLASAPKPPIWASRICWAVIWGGAKRMGEETHRTTHPPEKFRTPPKELLVCSVIDFCTGKTEQCHLRGWKTYQTRSKTLFWEGCPS